MMSPVSTNAVFAGLIPGDGIGREVIPVSPNDCHKEAMLNNSGWSATPGSPPCISGLEVFLY